MSLVKAIQEGHTEELPQILLNIFILDVDGQTILARIWVGSIVANVQLVHMHGDQYIYFTVYN